MTGAALMFTQLWQRNWVWGSGFTVNTLRVDCRGFSMSCPKPDLAGVEGSRIGVVKPHKTPATSFKTRQKTMNNPVMSCDIPEKAVPGRTRLRSPKQIPE